MPEQEVLRKYILGDLSHDDCLPEVEERLMQDGAYFEELSIVEEDLIQAYVGEKLNDVDRVKFEKRFLISDENYRRLKFARSMARVIDEADKETAVNKGAAANYRHRFDVFSPVFVGSFSAVVFAIAMITAWQLSLPGQNESLIAWNKAYERVRPIESRVTDLAYAPHSVTRGDDTAGINKDELDISKVLAQKAIRDSASADNLHMLGRIHLTEGEFDNAIKQLKQAINITPGNPKIHNDLAVAWLEKGKAAGRDLVFLGNSLRELKKAIELDKDLAAAYFNRAICLDLMDAATEANGARQEYLKIDSSSKWAEEVKQKLKSRKAVGNQSKTSAELLRDFLAVKQKKDDVRAWQMLSRNRESVSGKLIPEQLAFSFSRTKKKEYLDALVYAGRIEFGKTGDSYWADIAKYYSTATKIRIEEMEKAHTSMQKGNRSYLAGETDDALNLFESAAEVFSKNNNVLEELNARYWIGFVYSVLDKYDKSTRIFKSVESFCRLKGYKWLLAHVQFWIGVNYASENEKSKAFDYYDKAVENARSVSDLYNTQKILTETASEYRLIGRPILSLKFLQESLSLSHYPEASVRQQYRTYDILVKVFFALENYEASLAYERAAIRLLDRIPDMAFRQASNRQLGQILTNQKKYTEALKFLLESKKNANAITSVEYRGQYDAKSDIAIADLYRERGEFNKALASYDKAVSFFDSSRHKEGSYIARKGRLFCHWATNNDTAFERELVDVLNFFEDHRKRILTEQNRNSYFDREHSVYDLAIDFEHRNGNYQRAYDYSELSRSRSLLDRIENGAEIEKSMTNLGVKLKGGPTPLTADEIRKQMPAEVQIVEYAVLDDRLLVWLLSKDGFEVVSTAIRSKDLKRLVESYLELVSSPDQGQNNKQQSLAKQLYKVLVNPIADKMDSSKIIAFVPDKFLFHLPFSSLISSKTNRFLIEERNFFLAPSANVFVVLSEKSQTMGKKSAESILSIGNPFFDPNQYPSLKPLFSAAKEAAEVARGYRKAKVLLAENALKENIKANLDKYNVMHFAGHYLVNETSPLLSALILSSNGKSTDRENSSLANYELIDEDLSKMRLVVLSACQSGIEGFYKGEGMIGASRSFLAAGVPLVVASQWAVDSAATSDLMIRFHKYRKRQNLSTTMALRSAQLDFINGTNEKFKHPYYWSAFMTVGGYSEY